MKNGIGSMVAVSVLSMAGAAHGAEWSADRTTDVGNRINTASVTDGSGSLDKIAGTLRAFVADGAASWDQDIYCIRITDGTAFSAIAYPSPGLPAGTIGDFNLALFDADGHGIAFNDNTTTEGIAQYPVLTNTFTSTLPAGDYYLAISRNSRNATTGVVRFNRPFAGGSLMFPGQTNATGPSDPTASLRTGEYSAMGSVFSGWEPHAFSFPFNDNYDIDLTGATFSVPAPGAAALLAVGVLGATRRRRA
jgi:hypothetical protein